MQQPLHARIQRGLLTACIVLTPLALGGAHPITNVVVAVVVLVAVGVGLAAPGPRGVSWLVPGLLLAGLGLTLLQLVPMPVSLYETLSPGTYDLLTLAPSARDEWRPVSLDLPATAHEAVKQVIYLGAGVLAIQLFRRSNAGALRQFLRPVAAAGAAVMFLGLVHAAAGFDKPYNAFGPVRQFFVSSFINPNHLAGFLGFCSIASLALSFEKSAERRWLSLIGAVAMGVGVVLSLSRGGIAAYITALAACSLAVSLHRARSQHSLARWVYGTLVVALAIGSYVAYSEVAGELRTLGDRNAYAKIDIWRPVGDLIAAFPLLGVGRGAFGMTFAHYSGLRGTVTFSHLENEWLQVLVDWGPVAGGGIALAVLFAFTRAVRHSTDRPQRLVAVFALVFLGLHNIMDFNLTLTAVGVPAFALLSLLGQPRRPRRRRAEVGRRPRLLPWLGFGGLVALVLTAGPYAVVYDSELEYDRARAALREAGPQGVEPIIRRHPSNFVLPMLVAEWHLYRKKDAVRAMPWINRAMYLSPRNADPHRLAGHALLLLGHRKQAMLEYRLACDYQPNMTKSVLEEIARLTGDPAVAVELRSELPHVREQIASFLLNHSEPAGALAVLDEDGPTHSIRGLAIAAEANLRLERFDEAEARARELERRAPASQVAYAVQARILRARGDTDAALAVLARGLAKAHEHDRLLWERARLLHVEGRYPEARAAARELLDVAHDPRTLGRAHEALGATLEAQDRRLDALRHYQKAVELDPQHAGRALALVRLRMRLGNVAGARSALERARAAGARSPALDEIAAEVEARQADEVQR